MLRKIKNDMQKEMPEDLKDAPQNTRDEFANAALVRGAIEKDKILSKIVRREGARVREVPKPPTKKT